MEGGGGVGETWELRMLWDSRCTLLALATLHVVMLPTDLPFLSLFLSPFDLHLYFSLPCCLDPRNPVRYR